MSADPSRQQGYRAGVALYGSEFVVGLVLVAISVGLLVMALTRDEPPGMVVSFIGLLAVAGGISLLTGAAAFYLTRPARRSPFADPWIGSRLAWCNFRSVAKRHAYWSPSGRVTPVTGAREVDLAVSERR